jgi:hypothetical protein
MFFTIIHIVIIIALALSVVSLVHVVQVLYETQIKMIKDQYRLRGEIDMIMNLVDPVNFSNTFNFSSEDIPVTTFEINMDGLAKPVESVNSEHA